MKIFEIDILEKGEKRWGNDLRGFQNDIVKFGCVKMLTSEGTWKINWHTN